MSAIRTVIVYPVRDLAVAKALFGKLLGITPYADQPYYVGFRIGDLEVGLDPHGHSRGMTGPVVYWEVKDIRATLQQLLDAGAEVQQPITDVGGGMRIAAVRTAEGHVLGLRQSPSPTS
nr:MAG: glyoxalase [Bacillota bacterium]